MQSRRRAPRRVFHVTGQSKVAGYLYQCFCELWKEKRLVFDREKSELRRPSRSFATQGNIVRRGRTVKELLHQDRERFSGKEALVERPSIVEATERVSTGKSRNWPNSPITNGLQLTAAADEI